MASEGYHEPLEDLQKLTIDMHRALTSLKEELEAVDWYGQRIDASNDPELRTILSHNRDEEKEHAVMLIEWIRRHDEFFNMQLQERLFREGAIVQEGE